MEDSQRAIDRANAAVAWYTVTRTLPPWFQDDQEVQAVVAGWAEAITAACLQIAENFNRTVVPAIAQIADDMRPVTQMMKARGMIEDTRADSIHRRR